MKKKEIEEEEIENACNWGDLPLDVFPLILNKLPDIGDFIRFRAACKPWRLYTSLSDLPSQFPWLVEVLCQGPDLHFYSIPYCRSYSTRTHSTYGKQLFGRTSCGYIIACQVQYYASNADHLSLVNPLNNHEVPLPALKYDFHEHLRFLTNISWICPSTFKKDDYVIVTDRARRLAVCKIGDDRWDIIGSASMKRCFYLKGLLFMLDLQTRVTEVMDIAGRKVLYVIQLPQSEIFRFSEIPHLVESREEILAVFRHPSSGSEVYRFDIYRLELGNGEGYPRWIKVRSIGDRILFLDFSTAHGFCLSDNDFGLFRGNFTTKFTNLFHNYTHHTHGNSLRASVAGFKGNRIYFRDRKDLRLAHAIAMYDIEKGQTFVTDSLFNGDDNIVTWYMPTLSHV
ncbi:F-box domain-containing protein [Rhynchospora pubera]|uniref:F-box domain-containing protein n=1 Tax=Rhynchospora pubera TaxID=906938 RepID=A0AAV8FTC1_9POAL|nr:F-box domain-containing protein [Rhynchospora pubera]